MDTHDAAGWTIFCPYYRNCMGNYATHINSCWDGLTSLVTKLNSIAQDRPCENNHNEVSCKYRFAFHLFAK